jgi:hypothetical protein
MARIPFWLKVGWTAWVAVWAPAYAIHHGSAGALWQFLWFCDVANFVITAGLWLESPLLLSWQAVSVVLVQILYLVDVLTRLLLGFHPFGGTGFLFDGSTPPHIVVLSVTLHALTPVVLFWSLARLGYDRRALPLQIVATAVLLVISYGAGPAKNVNWSHGPFGGPQSVVPPAAYLAVAVAGYAILLYLPAHFFFSRVWPRARPKPRPPDVVDNCC